MQTGYCLLRCGVFWYGRLLPEFWRNLLLSSLQLLPILKMEAAGFSKMLVIIYQTVQNHIWKRMIFMVFMNTANLMGSINLLDEHTDNEFGTKFNAIVRDSLN
jgi:hypothetical protein